MQKYVEEAFKLLSNAVMKQNETISELTADDWEQVFGILCKNAVYGMCYKYIESNNERLKVPSALLSEWKKITFLGGLKQLSRREKLKNMLLEAQKNNIKIILFKGVVLAGMYPEPSLRFSDDTDMLINAEQREATLELFRKNGYLCTVQKHNVDSLVKDNRFIVELHTSLWENMVGKRIQKLENLKLTAEDTLIPFPFGNAEAFTLGYTEHLIYQIYHIAKHFSMGQIGIKYLLDISKYYNEYEKNINISFLWEAMKKIKLKDFCLRLFDICIHYLSMNKSILNNQEFHLEAEERYYLLRMFIVEEIIKPGAELDLAGITIPYFSDEMIRNSNRSFRYLKMLFPNIQQMGKKYPYVKKYKILLPVAWVERSISFIKNRNNNKNKLNIPEKMTKADEQIKKMKDMKMID